MEKYPTYKQSGIKWIGDIPVHWSSEQLRKYLRLISIKNKPNEQLLSVTREQGVIVRNVESKEENHNFIPEDLSGYKYVRKEQFAINKMKSWQGSYGVSNFDGIVSPAYFVCELNNINQEFFSWAIRSKAYVGFFTQMSKGIRVDQWDLSPIALKQIPFFEPPKDEQLSIVAFLEKATANIDAYIKQRQQEIIALNELKQAEIAEVVTKGLNPNAPMKDSGIAWIGDIPEYWDVLPFKAVFTMKSITNRIEEELLSVYLDKGVIKFSDVETKRTNTTSQDLSKYQLVEKGDFVLNNQQAWRGSVGVSMYKGIVSPAYIILSLSNKFNIKYANYLLRDKSMVTNYFLTSRGVGTIQRNLYWNELKRKKILIPPIKEQQQIVDYIESKTSKIEEYITTLKSEIAQMQEYKQRLISDVVTGKMKV